MVDVSFRRARADDAAALQALYRVLVAQPDVRVTAESVAALESDPTNVLVVATRGADVVATAFLVICRDVMYGGDQPFAIVENVVVDPASRNLGVGAALMAHLASECRARRCTKIIKRGFVTYLNR